PAAAAVVLAGAVAASCKLLDLFVPGTDLVAVINPIQAILLESLAGAFWVAMKAEPRVTALVRGRAGSGRP
ncbi:MAG TPA: hypothetical protein VLJ16_06525, partial [Acidobacteriota bacterium]|nr:hypothetical protein [Acidobacteriota bacterium]